MEAYFPIKSKRTLINYMLAEVSSVNNFRVARLSFVLGFYENYLVKYPTKSEDPDSPFAELSWASLNSALSTLPLCFISVGATDTITSRATLHEIEEVIRAQIVNSNGAVARDKPHAHTLHAFIHEKTISDTGLLFTMVTLCHELGLQDVFLSFSEAATWISFGPSNSDYYFIRKRTYDGSVERAKSAAAASRTWFYLSGHPVVARDPRMLASALVLSMSTVGDTRSGKESACLVDFQKSLLWALHDVHLLDDYPMCVTLLGNLEKDHVDLQEESATLSLAKVDQIQQLYSKAIDCAQLSYDDSMVYPYLCYGSFLHGVGHLIEATDKWREAACVLRSYTYHFEDTEIYEQVTKTTATFAEVAKLLSRSGTPDQQRRCLANFLLFTDAVYQWAESCPTRVLHTLWVANFLKVLQVFPSECRRSIIIRSYFDLGLGDKKVAKYANEEVAKSTEVIPVPQKEPAIEEQEAHARFLKTNQDSVLAHADLYLMLFDQIKEGSSQKSGPTKNEHEHITEAMLYGNSEFDRLDLSAEDKADLNRLESEVFNLDDFIISADAAIGRMPKPRHNLEAAAKKKLNDPGNVAEVKEESQPETTVDDAIKDEEQSVENQDIAATSETVDLISSNSSDDEMEDADLGTNVVASTSDERIDDVLGEVASSGLVTSALEDSIESAIQDVLFQQFGSPPRDNMARPNDEDTICVKTSPRLAKLNIQREKAQTSYKNKTGGKISQQPEPSPEDVSTSSSSKVDDEQYNSVIGDPNFVRRAYFKPFRCFIAPPEPVDSSQRYDRKPAVTGNATGYRRKAGRKRGAATASRNRGFASSKTEPDAEFIDGAAEASNQSQNNNLVVPDNDPLGDENTGSTSGRVTDPGNASEAINIPQEEQKGYVNEKPEKKTLASYAVIVRSRKMVAIRDLIVSKRLATGSIRLQLECLEISGASGNENSRSGGGSNQFAELTTSSTGTTRTRSGRIQRSRAPVIDTVQEDDDIEEKPQRKRGRRR